MSLGNNSGLWQNNLVPTVTVALKGSKVATMNAGRMGVQKPKARTHARRRERKPFFPDSTELAAVVRE